MIALFIFIVGTFLGSFMNVCIYRMPKKESIVMPRSHCTTCNAPILWFDNIPIISFILLRGRCRHCKEKISSRYATVELISGILYLLLYLNFGLTPKFLIFCYLISSLIVVSFIDLKTQEIPDSITLPGIILGLVVAGVYPELLKETTALKGLLSSFLGVIAGGGSIFLEINL